MPFLCWAALVMIRFLDGFFFIAMNVYLGSGLLSILDIENKGRWHLNFLVH